MKTVMKLCLALLVVGLVSMVLLKKDNPSKEEKAQISTETPSMSDSSQLSSIPTPAQTDSPSALDPEVEETVEEAMTEMLGPAPLADAEELQETERLPLADL